MLKKLFGWGQREEDGKGRTASAYGVDLAMSYCPRCGDEYRAGVTRCHTCEVDLISGEEKLAVLKAEESSRNARSVDISEEDRLIPVRGGKLRDLKPLQMILAQETVPALITGEQGGCAKG